MFVQKYLNANSVDSDLSLHCLQEFLFMERYAYMGLAGAGGVRRSAITKTRLYNFDPLKPHFYIVKLGFTGVYIIFLISAQKHRLWVLVRTAVLTSTHNIYFNEYPQYIFWAEIWKISEFLSENSHFFFVVKFSIYLNRCVFVMKLSSCTWRDLIKPSL